WSPRSYPPLRDACVPARPPFVPARPPFGQRPAPRQAEPFLRQIVEAARERLTAAATFPESATPEKVDLTAGTAFEILPSFSCTADVAVQRKFGADRKTAPDGQRRGVAFPLRGLSVAPPAVWRPRCVHARTTGFHQLGRTVPWAA